MAENNWALVGNAGTNPSSNFLGTTDEKPLILKTHGVEAMRITPGSTIQVNGSRTTPGNVGIGISNPDAKLEVSSTADFNSPQVHIQQTKPGEFARLRFNSTGTGAGDPDRPPPPQPVPLPLWDIAVGSFRNVMNFFFQNIGNIMTVTPEGRVGIRTENPTTELHVNGTATVGILQITGGADVAEPFLLEENLEIEPGTVMTIDKHNPGTLRTSDTAYDRKVAGVVSGARGLKPGLTLQQGYAQEKQMPVALAGRVYCKAEAISSPIEVGDLLTTLKIRGHAMKAVDPQASQGATLGKAMSSLKEDTGLILVLVTLQ